MGRVHPPGLAVDKRRTKRQKADGRAGESLRPVGPPDSAAADSEEAGHVFDGEVRFRAAERGAALGGALRGENVEGV